MPPILVPFSFLREKSSNDVTFHITAPKEQNRKKDIPNSEGVVWSVRR